MKKILSVILAVVIVATLSLSATVLVSAKVDPQFVVSSETAKAGVTKDITISLVNNPGIASINIDVSFPSDLTLNSVTYNGAGLGGMSNPPESLTSPVTLNWFNGLANTEGDMVFATLNFTVSNEATEGDKTITISYDPDNVYDIDEENLDFVVVSGKITVVSCFHENTTQVAAVASTCNTQGHGAYTKCTDCGAVIEGSDALLPLDSNNHAGDTEVRNAANATCTEKGYTGDTYCKGCNAKISSGSDIDALGHNYVPVVTNPTCTAGGYTTYTCSRCKDSYTGNNTNPTGHTGGTATCHSKAICSVCKAEYGEFDANNHDGDTEVRDAKAATCTEKGYTGDTYCKGCNTKIADGKDIEMTAHTPGEWKTTDEAHWKECTNCHTVIGESESHSFEEKVLEEPTTEKEGKKAQVCTVCGYYNEQTVETIAKLISYEVAQTDGKTENETAVYDGKDSKAVSYTAKFAKAKFSAVKVNGEVVAAENYDVIEDGKGNTVVTFKDEYLKKLANGNYNVIMVADDGIAESTLTVKNNNATDTNTNTDTVNNTDANKTASPKTSDTDIIFLVLALLAVMSVSVFAGITYKRKNESK